MVSIYLSLIISYPMSKTLFAVILALLLLTGHSQTNDAVFAFSWYEGHCMNIASTGGCDPAKLALWDHQSFTIHGLWPTARTTNKYGDFNLSIIEEDPELLDNMQNYWPPQSRATGSETFLWEHEWNEHGHDYAELIYRVQPSRFAGLEGEELNRALQSAFFHDVVAFYESYPGAIRFPSGKLTKTSLASAFGVKSMDLTLSCPRGFLIREIKLCFAITPTGHTVKACVNQANVGCKKGNDFELPAWRVSEQDRVVAYETADSNTESDV